MSHKKAVDLFVVAGTLCFLSLPPRAQQNMFSGTLWHISNRQKRSSVSE